MSNHMKKTVAQLRAEKEQRKQDFIDGREITQEVLLAFERLRRDSKNHDELGALLVEAKRGCKLLQADPETSIYRAALHTMADIHNKLGQNKDAMSLYWQLDELFGAAERKGSTNSDDHSLWCSTLAALGFMHIDVGQLDVAKRCFQRILEWPRLLPAVDRINALRGMTEYYQACSDWSSVIRSCEEALAISPEVNNPKMEWRLLLSLADAAEAKGDMRQARDYDEKAETVWHRSGASSQNGQTLELLPSYRRKAIVLIAAGVPHLAIQMLAFVSQLYVRILERQDVSLMACPTLLDPIMAALLVLADALAANGVGDDVAEAFWTRADVKETRAIIAGYREGLLEETRKELEEQRRAMAVTAVAVAAAPPLKKSKAAKRKQQKRRSQREKKAAERAEGDAAAAAAAAQGGKTNERREEQREQAQQEEELEEEQDQMEEERNSKEEGVPAVMVAAVAGMALGQKEEEEEQEECSVCLNAIESEDAENAVGPPLICGHRYHAFCLQFWVEKCRSKSIKVSCPYCRSPLHELESS